MHYQSLSRNAEKLLRFLEEHHRTNFTGSLADFLPFLQTVQNIFPDWVLMTCPVHHPDIWFITENAKTILGISPYLFSRSVSPDFLFARIHEDDLEDINHCFLFVDNFFKNRMPEEYPLLRCIFYYRFRQDDNYLVLHDEKATLRLNNENLLYYSMIKDITGESVFSGVRVEIYKSGLKPERIASYKPVSEHINLSRRETELVGLIKRGLTTKEMAYQLNISQNTVRNMKQKMFEKYNVSNVIELLNKTVHYN